MVVGHARTYSVRRVPRGSLIDISLVPEQSHNFYFSIVRLEVMAMMGTSANMKQVTCENFPMLRVSNYLSVFYSIYPLRCSLHLFSIFHSTLTIEHSQDPSEINSAGSCFRASNDVIQID